MQVGYARTSDGTVSSGWWEGEELESQLRSTLFSPDVPEVWVRPTPNGAALVLKLKGKLLINYIPGS